MQSLVVFFALAAVACGSIIPYAQPAHHAAVVLDPHGRPLDTAEVINARAIHLQAKALEPVSHGAVLAAPIAHAAVVAAPVAHAAIVAPAVVAAPADAVSHQSRVDVRTSPAIVAHAAPVLAAAPIISAHGLGAHSLAAPWLGSAHGLAGHGHLLKRRSLGHLAYSAPIAIVPSAVSHQSRVDVVSSPAIVSHAVASPVVAHAVAAPVVSHAIAPAAVSHQSRVDVRTSPAIVAHAAPVAVAAPVLSAHGLGAHSLATPWLNSALIAGHGHLLKRRSLGHLAYSAPIAIAPAAVSHQSRVDIVSNPAIVSHAVAAPVVAHAVTTPVVTHAIAPAAVSHQSRVDIRTSPAISITAVAPIAHSLVARAPLVHAAPYAHAAGSLVHGW